MNSQNKEMLIALFSSEAVCENIRNGKLQKGDLGIAVIAPVETNAEQIFKCIEVFLRVAQEGAEAVNQSQKKAGMLDAFAKKISSLFPRIAKKCQKEEDVIPAEFLADAHKKLSYVFISMSYPFERSFACDLDKLTLNLLREELQID